MESDHPIERNMLIKINSQVLKNAKSMLLIRERLLNRINTLNSHLGRIRKHLGLLNKV